MDLRQFKYFVAIVDYASLSRAAQHLHVAQPALSQHVRHMEDELQVRLLDRTPRGVLPTDEGKRLYLHAKKVLTLAAETQDAVRDALLNPAGEVRVGISGGVGELLAVPLIQSAAQRYSNLRIRPVEGSDGQVLQWLRRGEVDVALLQPPAAASDLELRPLATEEVFLFAKAGMQWLQAAPESAIAIAQALALPLILPGPDSGLRSLFEDAARSVTGTVSPRFELDSHSQIRQLALAGAGCGILPENAIAAELRQGLVERWRIGDSGLHRRMAVASSRERHLTTATRAVIQLAVNVTREAVSDGSWRASLLAVQDDMQL